MRIAWDAGDYEAVWAKRMQFGVLSSGGADQPTWFWFNALPALAARRLGKTDHPLFGLACGNASAATDWDDPVQREAEAIFNRQ
jgi:hypothetical protein